MNDIHGQEITVGAHVAYVHGKNSGASLRTGTVSKLYKGQHGAEECSVTSDTGTMAHVKSSRILILDERTPE